LWHYPIISKNLEISRKKYPTRGHNKGGRGGLSRNWWDGVRGCRALPFLAF